MSQAGLEHFLGEGRQKFIFSLGRESAPDKNNFADPKNGIRPWWKILDIPLMGLNDYFSLNS